MKLAHGGVEQDIEFSVEIFESRKWHNKYKELDVDEAEEVVENNEHQIFITRIKRIAVEFESLPRIFLECLHFSFALFAGRSSGI